MSVLVTGGAGYIGSHMALRLLDAGEQVVIADDLSRGFTRLIPDGAHFIKADIADRRTMTDLLRAHRIEAVIHFAGYVVVPESVSDPMLYYDRNTAATKRLIEASLEAGMEKFIFSSTAAVYGEPETPAVTETTPARPISPYGRSKLMSEMMLEDAGAAHDLRSIRLRYFNVAGADPQGRSGQAAPNATHLIKVLSQLAVGKREQITVFGTDYPTPDGTCIRDYIHVCDLVDAHYAALNYLRDGGSSATLNCGYGRGASVLDVIAAFERVSGETLNVEMGERRAGDPSALIADNAQLRGLLDWSPHHDDLDHIVKTALSWERALKT